MWGTPKLFSALVRGPGRVGASCAFLQACIHPQGCVQGHWWIFHTKSQDCIYTLKFCLQRPGVRKMTRTGPEASRVRETSVVRDKRGEGGMDSRAI